MSESGKLIYLGVVIGAHGVRGFVKIKSFTSKMENIAKLPLRDSTGNTVAIKLVRVAKDVVICAIDGITDREHAEKMRGMKLYTTRINLAPTSESEYYIEDLKELPVRNPAGKQLGCISEVYNFGAGDIIEIAFSDGKTEMYPFKDEIFVEVAKNYVVFEEPITVVDQ